MASQYRKIQDMETVLFHPESPVVIEKMRLQHDQIYDVNVLQITFRNVSPYNIYGLGISVVLRDENGKKLFNEIEFNYYSIEVQPGKTFGASEDIVVEAGASRYDITVLRADMSHGRDFHGRCVMKAEPKRIDLSTLEDLQEPYIERVLKIKPKAKVVCVAENTDKYWRCTCGRIYPKIIKQCTSCRLLNTDLIDIIPQLKEEKKQREIEEEKKRIEAEEAEKKRLEEEERKRQEEEQRRREEEEERQRQESERIRKEAEEAERKRLEEEELARQKAEKVKKIKKYCSIGAASVIAIILAIVFIPNLFGSEDEGDGNISIGKGSDTDYEYSASVTSSDTDSSGIPEVSRTDLVDIKPIEGTKSTNIALMADSLDETETSTVWRLFGKTEDSFEHETKYINSGTQTAYMLDVLGSKHIERKALSCALIESKEAGYGLKIKTFNITYCTKKMYKEALAELGITDADVIVAAPQKASGSAALASIYKLANKKSTDNGNVIGTAVSYGNMNVRTGPSAGQSSYGTTKPGQKVEVLDMLDNGWMKIVWEDAREGYAYTCYMYNGEKYYDFYPY